MKKIITTEDLLNDRTIFTEERANKIKENVAKEVARIRGGARENSGRKAIVSGKILKFTKRLTEEEAKFIDYAREHHINYDELMEG